MARTTNRCAARSIVVYGFPRGTAINYTYFRSERRKWLPYLDGVDSVMFLVNLCGYQNFLYEDDDIFSAEVLELEDAPLVN